MDDDGLKATPHGVDSTVHHECTGGAGLLAACMAWWRGRRREAVAGAAPTAEDRDITPAEPWEGMEAELSRARALRDEAVATAAATEAAMEAADRAIRGLRAQRDALLSALKDVVPILADAESLPELRLYTMRGDKVDVGAARRRLAKILADVEAEIGAMRQSGE